jgi:hypothetical protein
MAQAAHWHGRMQESYIPPALCTSTSPSRALTLLLDYETNCLVRDVTPPAISIFQGGIPYLFQHHFQFSY